MNRKILAAGAFLGGLGIILGAFGAHSLKELVPAESVLVFETGVRYQMYTAFFLLALGLIPVISEKAKSIIYKLSVSGILLFSGSIYILATKSLSGIDFKIIGIATPVGGLLLILGWIWLFVNILRQKS